MELWANRLMTLQTFFAKEGLDWLAELSQIAEGESAMKSLGLTIADVLRKNAKPAKPAKPEEEEEEEEESSKPAKG